MGTACGVLATGTALIVSVSVAVLLAALGSVTPPGAVMVAVLDSVPVAEALSVPVMVKVTAAPTGRFTSSLRLPLPEAVQVPPAEPTQVQVTPLREAGSVSATVAPVTLTGPALLAVSV